MGLVQEENPVVARQRTKKWRTQEDLALSQPWVSAGMEERQRASIVFWTESERSDRRETLKKSRGKCCDWS